MKLAPLRINWSTTARWSIGSQVVGLSKKLYQGSTPRIANTGLRTTGAAVGSPGGSRSGTDSLPRKKPNPSSRSRPYTAQTAPAGVRPAARTTGVPARVTLASSYPSSPRLDQGPSAWPMSALPATVPSTTAGPGCLRQSATLTTAGTVPLT